MKGELRTVDRRHQIDPPSQHHLSLSVSSFIGILIYARADRRELAVASGLKVLTTMIEADRLAMYGPGCQHQAERSLARRHAPECSAFAGADTLAARADIGDTPSRASTKRRTASISACGIGSGPDCHTRCE
jgi:hypothetical protein